MTRPALPRLLPAAVLLASGVAHAQTAPPPPTETVATDDAVPDDLGRLILDTGRPLTKPAEPDLVRFQVHGEYQFRYEHLRSFPLDASATDAATHPGTLSDSLGQNDFAYHWLRITPRLQIKKAIEIVAQLDLVTGVAFGDLAHDTTADQTPRDEYNGFSNVQPRWLYAQLNTEYGVFRVGQQPSHWGMGIVANDGDRPPLFGDYRYGNIVERVLFGTKPGGRDSDFTVAVAGDIVYRDNVARITRGDNAYQGVLAAYWERGPDQLGLYGVYRHQEHDRTSGASLFPYLETLDVGVIDVAGKVAARVPNSDAFVFGAGEVATILGSTNALRTADQARSGQTTSVRSYGGAVQVGVVHRAQCGCSAASPDPQDRTFGDVVGQVEVGYASGDSDPYADVTHRFTFDPNHKVGLLLFDEVMRFQTARAATAAADPLLANGGRPPPGVDLLPSNGGVFGAQYINPTAIVRPFRWLDFKGGVVIAQATADVVDPYRLATQGAYVNYRGGDPKRRDLGVEADVGTEARFRLDYGLRLMIGAQGGVLFPGGALADASGATMKAPWIFVGRAGLLF
jgi:hypothetical protein